MAIKFVGTWCKNWWVYCCVYTPDFGSVHHPIVTLESETVSARAKWSLWSRIRIPGYLHPANQFLPYPRKSTFENSVRMHQHSSWSISDNKVGSSVGLSACPVLMSTWLDVFKNIFINEPLRSSSFDTPFHSHGRNVITLRALAWPVLVSAQKMMTYTFSFPTWRTSENFGAGGYSSENLQNCHLANTFKEEDNSELRLRGLRLSGHTIQDKSRSNKVV